MGVFDLGANGWGRDISFPIAARGDGIKRLAVGSFKRDSAILMASAYHPSGAMKPPETIEFQLPLQLQMTGTGGAPRIARLNASNCVHSLVRGDLAMAKPNLLADPFIRNPFFLGYDRKLTRRRDPSRSK